jgi:hypothetical protein
MAIIYTYPTKATPNDNDLILISDSEDSNKTKQVKISTLPGGSGSGVSSVTAVLPLASTGGGTPAISLTGLTGFGTTGQVIKVNSNADGLEWGADGGSVPAGNIYEVQYNGNGEFVASTTFTYENRVLSLGVVGDTAASSLKIYGGGSADSRLTLFCSAGDHGVTLEGPDHTGGTPGSYTIKLPNSLPSVANQILESNASGALSWIPTPSSGGSYTAGDGLQLNGTVFSTDLKENGGLVIESNELALDLSASSITGTLATSDGGTGSSSTEYCDLASNVTGILPITQGGTGLNTVGTTSGYVLTSDGSSAASWAASTNISNTDLSFSANRTLDIGNKSLTIIDTGSGSTKNLFKFVAANATDPTFTVGHTTSAEGYIVIEGNGSNRTGQVQFKNAVGDHYTGIKATPTQAATINYTLPATQGAIGEFLKNDGTGVLSWDQAASYEEGTWNPVMFNSSSPTYTSTGTFIKIGKKVTVWFHIDCTAGGVASIVSTISGLPFNTVSANGRRGSAVINNNTATVTSSNYVGGKPGGSTTIILQRYPSSSSYPYLLENALWPNSQGSFTVEGQFTYYSV